MTNAVWIASNPYRAQRQEDIHVCPTPQDPVLRQKQKKCWPSKPLALKEGNEKITNQGHMAPSMKNCCELPEGAAQVPPKRHGDNTPAKPTKSLDNQLLRPAVPSQPCREWPEGARDPPTSQ